MAIRLGSAYGQVNLDASGVKQGTRQAQGALVGLEKAGSAAMAALGLSVVGMSLALVKGVGRATGMASEFQTSMTGLELAASETAMTFGDLHSTAITVGGDTRLLGVSATGAAEAMDEMYRSGLNNTVVFGDLQGYLAGTAELGGALRASIDLAAASELDMIQASEAATGVLGMFGSELASDAEKAEFVVTALDNMVRSANASRAEVRDMLAALQNVGTEFNRFGYSIEDTNNALAILSENEIMGAEAGTALKSMMLNMTRQTDEVIEAFAELNVELYDQRGQMRSLPDIIGQLEGAFAGLTDEQRDHYMQTIAGTYGIRALSALINKGTDGWHEMADATARATSMQEQAAAMAQTYAGKVEALEGNVETLGIMIGEEFLPVAEDWVNWATEMVEKHGDTLVGMAGSLAEILQVISDILQGQGDRWAVAGTRLAGFTLAAGGLISTGARLVTTFQTLGPAVSSAVGGLNALSAGASMAEVSSMGLAAALGPLAVAALLVGSAAAAYAKWQQLQADTAERTSKVTGEWTGFLQEQSEELTSAVEVADAYTRKQEEIADIYEDAGVLADLFIDRQEVMNAETEDLGDALVASATDYEDYLAAVEQVNNGMVDQSTTMSELAWAYDHMVDPLSETSFALLRGEQVMDSVTTRAQGLRSETEELAQAEAAAAYEAEAMAEANRASAQTLLRQIDALEGLGALSRSEAAEMRAALTDEFGAITTETGKVTAAQERLAAVAWDAWDTFAENVRQGVDEALKAYREGNEDMLAEQQRALGQMLLAQAESKVAAGLISPEQMKDMRLAIHDAYGIVVDETELATDHLLGMYSDWAAGGETSIDDLISFIDNLGPEAEAMAREQEVALTKADEHWRNLKEGVMTYGGEMALAAEAASSDIGDSFRGMEETFDSTVTQLGVVEAALLGMPTEHTFTFNYQTEGEIPSFPSGPADKGTPGHAYAAGTDYAAGGWALVGERGPELAYLRQGTQVMSAQETSALLGHAVELARRLEGAAAPGAGVPPEPRASSISVGPIYASVANDLDLEFLARRVATLIQRRQGGRG
jgi:TP901 family phage tail tape measure protein